MQKFSPANLSPFTVNSHSATKFQSLHMTLAINILDECGLSKTASCECLPKEIPY